MVSETLKLTTNNTCDSNSPLFRPDSTPVEWWISDELVSYPVALATMKQRAMDIAAGKAGEAIWLIEHPPLYTSGTSARRDDLLQPEKFPVYEAGRGGQYTYHGPGQRIAYVMLDLRERGRDIRCLVSGLEGWIIDTLAAFNVRGDRREGRVGVWVERPERGFMSEDKIAALGVRVSKWVTYHGISLNVSPDLTHYRGIVPCGISDHGVTSLEDLGQIVSMPEVDAVLRKTFVDRFGPVRSADPVLTNLLD